MAEALANLTLRVEAQQEQQLAQELARQAARRCSDYCARPAAKSRRCKRGTRLLPDRAPARRERRVSGCVQCAAERTTPVAVIATVGYVHETIRSGDAFNELS